MFQPQKHELSSDLLIQIEAAPEFIPVRQA